MGTRYGPKSSGSVYNFCISQVRHKFFFLIDSVLDKDSWFFFPEWQGFGLLFLQMAYVNEFNPYA